MNVFIDTNVLLNFYALSGGDLDEIEKLSQLVLTNKLTLFISNYLQDEFMRNREGKIAEALSTFEKSKVELHRPNIVRVHDESVELEKLQGQFQQLVKKLQDRVRKEAANQSTKADEVIQELFKNVDSEDVTDKVIERAMRRVVLRQPPGKKDSHGDAINWEWLMVKVTDGEDLHVISQDGDFESPLTKGTLSSYLADEWKRRKQSQLHYYPTLTDFLKKHFPDIELTDQIEKLVAIERFEKSPSFATTHKAIDILSKVEDFTPDEINRLVAAMLSNKQIRWIIGDSDVEEFVRKLFSQALEKGLLTDAIELENLIQDLETEEVGT